MPVQNAPKPVASVQTRYGMVDLVSLELRPRSDGWIEVWGKTPEGKLFHVPVLLTTEAIQQLGGVK